MQIRTRNQEKKKLRILNSESEYRYEMEMWSCLHDGKAGSLGSWKEVDQGSQVDMGRLGRY